MRKLFMVGMALATFLLLNGNGSAAPVQLQSGEIVSLLETAVAGTPTGVGAVELFVDPAFPGVGYANVVIDLDEDGLEATTDDWWVQNFALVLEPSANGNVAFTFDLEGLTPVGDFDVYASFTPSPVGTPSVGSMVLTGNVPFGLYDIGDLQEGTAAGLDAASAPAVEDSSLAVDEVVADTGPVSEHTALNQIIGRTRFDIPGITQAKNECAPTSAAQSLLWLKERYGDLEGLPAQGDLINRLKTAMKWNNGIFPADFVPGKKKVIADLKLPVTTKSGGNFNGAGTFEFIKNEIEAGEDVEMRIQYHPAPQAGGHWVTVAGWYDDGTTKELCFKDPLTETDEETGDTEVTCYTIEGTTIKNYLWGNPATATTVSFAVSESIISVGGIVELAVDGSDGPASAAQGSGASAPPYAAIAGAAAAAAALSAGGWYARRRWLR